MKKLLITLFISVFCSHAFSQSSYKFSLDTLTTYQNYFRNQGIIPCAYGGYLRHDIFHSATSDEYRLIKFDSAGTIEWTKSSDYSTHVKLNGAFFMCPNGMQVSIW